MDAGRKYRLLRELGTGTFGTVYQAEMTSQGGFKKTVALKVLHPVWEADPDAARRFRDEARLLGQLHHRHIVQVDGLVKVGGRWAVVMEFVPGCDGSVVLKACRRAGEPFPVPAALEVVSAVGAALDAAWETVGPEGTPLRVIHRDIKPSNIRLTEDGDVKVLDFGIARAQFEGREAMTHSVRYGSVRYMAPERHNKTAKDSPAGDVFALGCVLYEFLTGRPLGSVEAEWAQHHEKVHVKVEKLREGLGKEGAGIADLIGRMLAFEPERRPTPTEVGDRARALARSYPGEDLATFCARFLPEVTRHVPDTSMPIERTVTEGGSGGSAGGSAGSHGSAGTASGPAAPPRGGQLAAIGGALVVGVLVIVGAFFLVGPDDHAISDKVGTPALATAAQVPTPPTSAVPPPPNAPVPADDAPITAPPDEAPIAAPPEYAHVAEPPPDTHVVKPPPDTHVVVKPPPDDTPPPQEGRPLRGAKFMLPSATALSATCNGAKATGTTSVLVRDLWPGPCTLTATVGGTNYKTVIDITAEQGLSCAVDGGALTCQ